MAISLQSYRSAWLRAWETRDCWHWIQQQSIQNLNPENPEIVVKNALPWMSPRMLCIPLHAILVTPVVTAVWETSMRKKCVGGAGGRTCHKGQEWVAMLVQVSVNLSTTGCLILATKCKTLFSWLVNCKLHLWSCAIAPILWHVCILQSTNGHRR